MERKLRRRSSGSPLREHGAHRSHQRNAGGVADWKPGGLFQTLDVEASSLLQGASALPQPSPGRPSGHYSHDELPACLGGHGQTVDSGGPLLSPLQGPPDI